MKILKSFILLILSALLAVIVFLRTTGPEEAPEEVIETPVPTYFLMNVPPSPTPSPEPTEDPNAVRLSSLRLSDADLAAIKATRTAQAAPLAEDLLFGGNALFYDSGNSRWFYSLIEDYAYAYDPAVECISGNGSVKVAFSNKEITDELIRNGSSIEVVTYSDTAYHSARLVCTTLPLMNISTPQEIGGEDVQTSITLFDNRRDADERWTESASRMHIRGGLARVFYKKNYKVTLLEAPGSDENRSVSLLGMRSDDDWHLASLFNDPERIRNVFSSELWKEGCAYNNSFRIENGMCYEYVEVFMNGSYHGLYALGYPIDAKQMELGRSPYGEAEEALFKIVSWTSEEKNLQENREQMYGYELKGVTPEGASDLAFQRLKQFYEVKINKSKEDPSVLYDIVEIGNAIDIHLFITLVQGGDNMGNGLKNMYMTAKQTGDKTIYLYTPWDLDMCWGNVWVDDYTINYVSHYFDGPEVNISLAYSVVQQLLNAGDKDIKGLIDQRYAELRSGAWSDERVLEILDEFEEDIFFSGAFGRDSVRWPWSSLEPGINDLSRYKEFVIARFAELDKYVSNLG